MRQIAKYISIYLCAFTGPLAGNAILSILPEMGESLVALENQVLLAIPAFMLPFAFFQLFSGTISDNWNRKNTLVIGMAVYGLSSLGITIADDYLIFMLLRVGQGVGYAFVGPVTIAFLGDITDKSRYGLASGFYGSSVTAGLLVGPLIAGLFASTDWHQAFLTYSLIAFVGVFLVFFILSDDRSGKIRSTESIFTNLRTAARNRNIMLISIIGAMAFLAMIGLLAFLSADLRSAEFGYSGFQMGMILAFYGVAGIIASPWAGMLTDRYSPRISIILGFAIAIPSTLALTISGEFFQFLALIGIIGGAGTFIWAGMMTISIREIPLLQGTCSSIFNSSRFSGYAISVIVLSPIYLEFGLSGVIIATAIILILAAVGAFMLAGRARIHWEEKKDKEEIGRLPGI